MAFFALATPLHLYLCDEVNIFICISTPLVGSPMPRAAAMVSPMTIIKKDTTMTGFKFLGAIFVCTLLYGCGSGTTEPTDNDEFFVIPDLDRVSEDDPFDSERLMVVQIQIDDNNFKTLASEGRSLAEAARTCPSHDFEYSKFNAKVSIDGEELDNIIIRKKGYLGSLSTSKPSFKLDFDEAVEGRRFKGLKRMTLNNNRQDPTNARQCLAYQLYEEAGIRVPKCSLARVYVNGEDMGVYTHVESIKKPFLERVFGDDDGNLYEAQVADFGINLNEKFEKKTNKTENDRSDLDAVAIALTLDDESFLSTIGTLVDMDAFYTQWAMDSILGNWDSAMGNANNYYVYRNPENDKFYYIPWGADAAFTGGNELIKPKVGPLYRNNRIANRLFEMENKRNELYSRINELLDEMWDENRFFSYIDSVQALTGAPQGPVDQLKGFFRGSETLSIANLPNRLAAAMADNAADQINYTLADDAPNCNTLSTTNITANFHTNEQSDQGTFSFKLEDGTPITANIFYTTQGPEQTDSITHFTVYETSPNMEYFIMIGVDQAQALQPNPDIYVLSVFIETPDFKPQTVDFHGLATSISLVQFLTDTQESVTLANSLSGYFDLTKTGDGSDADPIAGTISGTLEFVE